MIYFKTFKISAANLCLFVSLSVLLGCVQEIETFTGFSPSLVVDGSVTNQPGKQKVRLSVSGRYNETPNYFQVEGATVIIVDDESNEELLTYAGSGVYETREDFIGVPGRSYQLRIKLKSGVEYESIPEKMIDVPALDNVYYKVSGTRLDFLAQFNDNAETENYYRWRYLGTYEVLAPVAEDMSRTNQRHKNSDCLRWDGIPPLAKDVTKCWANEYDNEFLKLESDELFNGRVISDFPLFSMDIERKMDRGYHIKVMQYSLTKSAYSFWSSIKEQMENNGTIFETSNYQIKGNIRSLTNPEEVILGYFSASAVSERNVFVFDFMGLFGPVPCETNNSGCYPERCLDCRKFAAGATVVKPAFWPY